MSKYEYIDSQRSDPVEHNPVYKMCAWLTVSTSGFYHSLSRPTSATAARREALSARAVLLQGHRRHLWVSADPCRPGRRGTECSPELVRQIMRTEGLVACQPRPFRVTTEADAQAAAEIPDLVKRDFEADRPGVKFVGDI